MSRSAAHIFFAIPELVLLLSTHVPRRDLTQCILVCKDWSRQFQPRLWKDLIINNRFIGLLDMVPSPTKAALTKNLSHIREVNVPHANQPELQLLVEGLPEQIGDSVSESSTLCTNLTRIDLDIIDFQLIHLMAKPILTLLNYNPRLTYLNVFIDIFEIDGVTAALSKLRHLQHLTVQSDYQPVGISDPLLFLRSCLALPELTELHFVEGAEMCWNNGDETTIRRELEVIINEAAMARSSQGTNARKITHLTLPSNSYRRNNPLPLPLLKSNMLDLKTFHIPWFGPDASFNEIEKVIREHCPNVRHLEHPGYDSETWDGHSARAVIRGCSGLQSFTSYSFDDSPGGAPLLILSEVVTHHHTTLEVLDLHESSMVFSRDLQEVLSRCKQLKRFWVMGTMNISNSSINFYDICRNDWVCTELRELGLTLDRCRPERDAFDEQDEDEEEGPGDPHMCHEACVCVPKRAYRQIGRLKKLEVLKIGVDNGFRARATEEEYAWDLTLSDGWLSELAGLKNLKSFRLAADFWREMGQAEVEFMHEQWPLLNEVTIWCDKSLFCIEPHWQWLLDKRPQLRFAPETCW